MRGIVAAAPRPLGSPCQWPAAGSPGCYDRADDGPQPRSPVALPDHKPATSVEADWVLLFTAWLVAAVATAGSLFFSQVMDFAPCVLCWYQRIFLFPLVVVLARGLFPLDRGVVKYALPLVALGWLVAAYHNLVYYGVVPEELQPCARGVSCSERYLELLGFLSIPMLSLLAFSALLGIFVTLSKRSRT
jgi:disulfide bond formation protein DsbB